MPAHGWNLLPCPRKTLDGAMEGLTYGQYAQHIAGDEAFNEQVFTSETGVGPLFVATSCGSCHAGDGKGHPFTTLTRFGQTDSTGNHFLSLGGPQLQNRSLPGYDPNKFLPGQRFQNLHLRSIPDWAFSELVPDEDILAIANANGNNPDGVRGHPNWIHISDFDLPRPGAISA